jgi:hypothetical protein
MDVLSRDSAFNAAQNPEATRMGAISLGLIVLGVLVDYFRWTQLTPMVLAWAALLGLLLVFAFVNFQAEGLTVLDALARLWERYPWLPRIEDPGTTAEDGAWHLDGERLRAPVLTAWGVISMVLWGLAWLWRRAVGDGTPWPLRRKLKVALSAGAAAWLAFVALYLLSSETFHDGPVRWLLTFAAMCVLPVIVSIYSLTVAHVLGGLSDRLAEGVVEIHPG